MILMPITGWSLSDPSQSRHNCSGSSPGNKIIFSTNFGRKLEYYTGMVFNIKNLSNVNLIQGGRYDNLLSNLGAKRKIPAVGAAINLNSYDS